MATTHQDTNVNQLVINKMTKQEYDNLSQVSDTELYLVEEQVDSVVTQGSTNPVQSSAVYDAIQQAGSNINDGTTTFVKNNETIGTISANQALDKTIKIPNDIIMCKMSDGIVYDSYITYTKIKQYLPDYPYYSDDLDWEIGGNPPTRANITADNYYLDVDTKHIFVADENLELLDITSLVVIHGDINKLYCNITDNKVYRYNGSTFVPLSNDIVDNLIISNNLAYPLEGTYIGQVGYTEPPIFYDRKAADFHTFVSQDNGKYFYDDIDNKVYIYIEQPNQHLYCVSDNELYYLENLDTTKTYLSYKTDKLYRTNNGENFNLIATTDYIDLKNKPLSVENSKVKYTLSDGTTKLTLAQEGDVKDIPITFTPDASSVRANIQSGDTIARIAQVINNNFGSYSFDSSSFELSSYVTDSNIYGRFLAGLGILIVYGWFRVVTSEIPTHARILRFKGYTPDNGYPRFIDEYSNNLMTLRTGDDGDWWSFDYRTSKSNIYWTGLPTVILLQKSSQ